MVYQYTKARGPIAAMYSSPGPCYALPGLVGQSTHDPRSIHAKGPAFPFGVRHGKFADDCSPGPCYLPNPKIYRNGVDGTPVYSVSGRQKEGTMFNTPGPGQYSPEKIGPSGKIQAPSYSFGTRLRPHSSEGTPAPNCYTLPGMLGKTYQSGRRQAPCYSLTGRSLTGSFHNDLRKTPGPGAYNTTNPNLYRNQQPLYSMTSRNMMPGDNTTKPGPGAYSPEKVTVIKQSAPGFSFRIRHSQYLTPLIAEPSE